MNKDIRVSVTFFTHPKTILLKRKLGPNAVLALQQLWCYCAQHRPDGDLTGMSDEAIEIASGWNGRKGVLCASFLDSDTKFLDRSNEGTFLHDWKDHNPWACGASQRSKKARIAALVKHGMKDEADAMRRACAEHANRMRQADSSSAPSPSPYPSPSPSPSPSPEEPSVFSEVFSKAVAIYPASGLQDGVSDGQAFSLFRSGVIVADHGPFLQAVRNYANSKRVRDGYVKQIVNFIRGGWWKNWVNVNPSGAEYVPDMSLYVERDKLQAEQAARDAAGIPRGPKRRPA